MKFMRLASSINKSIHHLEKENSDFKQNILNLKKEITKVEKENTKLTEQLDAIRQREIDRLEETDLDDVDLVSENTKKKQLTKKPPHPLVPSIDLDKMRKMQEEELNKMRIIKNELDEDIPFQDDIIGVGPNDEEAEEYTSKILQKLHYLNSQKSCDHKIAFP